MTSIQYSSLRVFLAFLSTQDPYNHPYDHSPSTRVPLWGIIFQYLIPLFCKISVLGYPYEKVFSSTRYPCLKSFQNLGILRRGVFQFLIPSYFVFIFSMSTIYLRLLINTKSYWCFFKVKLLIVADSWVYLLSEFRLVSAVNDKSWNSDFKFEY